MADNIVIRLFEHPDQPVEWMLTDATGARHGAPERGALSAAAAAVGSHNVIIMLPAEDALITSAEVPAKGAKLLQALPYALEEQLAEDVDKLHFAAGKRRSNGRTPVAIIQRERIDSYMTRLRTAGIEPAAVYSEAQGLARIPGTISLLIDGETLIANNGDDTEVALRALSPGDALVALGALDDESDRQDDDEDSAPRLPKHVLVYLNEDDNARYENDWLALRNELDSIEPRILPDGALPRLAATLSTGKAINLLQGDYAVKKSMSAAWQPWRLVAGLAVIMGLLASVERITGYYALKREHNRVQVELTEQWGKTVPWISPMPENPGRRLDSELRRIGAQGNSAGDALFLRSLQAVAGAMVDNRDAAIQGISFRSGATDIQLTVPNETVLDKIRSSIGQNNALEASIQRLDRDDREGNYKGRLQIKGPAT